MSVRVVARIRPLLKSEIEKDVIVEAPTSSSVAIPNPKNAAEKYTFQFNNVYGSESSQQDIFEGEISPTIKHLFGGFDVTMFAYGVTGTGKTHTMRGGKSLSERGVIPRLLSNIYRRSRKIEKDSSGERKVDVSLSYYEIYNDRVYDLFEPPEKRTQAGLPIRDNNGKTVVAGLTERPCPTLKDFEQLYDEANVNRSTSATKLNAHSSRSHAILAVKVAQTFEDRTVISTVSAIDLAGSEDNRRTDNNKERLVESSSINKSLFVLAQCVEAISKHQSRIPYRESKMTRILSLGQNKGLTVMILNLAPIRSYHLDTLSSLTFANRTRKIEIREVENEPIFKGKQPSTHVSAGSGPSILRQPLRPIPATANASLRTFDQSNNKPAKEFSVFAEKKNTNRLSDLRKSNGIKRDATAVQSLPARSSKVIRTSGPAKEPKGSGLSRTDLEDLVNKMVDEKLAKQALSDSEKQANPATIDNELRKRLESLEQRVVKQEDGRAEGLQYLLMAKQHQVRGEDSSALKMYQLALPFFPDNEKLGQKMLALREKIAGKIVSSRNSASEVERSAHQSKRLDDSEDEYQDDVNVHEGEEDESDASFYLKSKPKNKKQKPSKLKIFCEPLPSTDLVDEGTLTPRSSQLLSIINTRDVSQIRALKGVGAKRAKLIVDCLCEVSENSQDEPISDLRQLGGLRGITSKMVDNMRSGLKSGI